MWDWLRRLWVGAPRTEDADPKADQVNAALDGLARDIHDLHRDGRPLDALAHNLNQHRLRRHLRDPS